MLSATPEPNNAVSPAVTPLSFIVGEDRFAGVASFLFWYFENPAAPRDKLNAARPKGTNSTTATTEPRNDTSQRSHLGGAAHKCPGRRPCRSIARAARIRCHT